MRQIIWVLAICVVSSPLHAQRVVENAFGWTVADIIEALPDTIPNASYPLAHGHWEGENGLGIDFNADGSALWFGRGYGERVSWWVLFAHDAGGEGKSGTVWLCALWPVVVAQEQRGVETKFGRVTYPNESDLGSCTLAEVGGRLIQMPDGNRMVEMTLDLGMAGKLTNTEPMPLPVGTESDISAKTDLVVTPIAFLRHGVWNAIGLNNGSEIRLVFDQDDDCLRCDSEISSGPVGELYAQVTVARFFGVGPLTTLNFTGQLYNGMNDRAARIVGERYGMPGADVVCGTLFGVSEGLMCFIFEMGFDGYIPGSNGSKLYNAVLQLKIVVSGELVFDGEMRNRIPLRITDDGTVIW